jgi:hypothetical protein
MVFTLEQKIFMIECYFSVLRLEEVYSSTQMTSFECFNRSLAC